MGSRNGQMYHFGGNHSSFLMIFFQGVLIINLYLGTGFLSIPVYLGKRSTTLYRYMYLKYLDNYNLISEWIQLPESDHS